MSNGLTLRYDPVTDTVKIRPRRVYKCRNDKSILPRKNVWKDKDGNYHCNTCNQFVEDITDTETGNDFMEIVGL